MSLVKSVFSPAAVAVLADLIPGGLVYYLLSSVLFKTCAPVEDASSYTFSLAAEKAGCAPGEDVFKRPYFMNTFVYVAISSCMFLYCYLSAADARSARREGTPVAPSSFTLKGFLLVFVPAFFDAVSRLLSYIAVTYVSGSVLLLIKGTRIVWTALLSLCVLPNYKLYAYNWVGLVLASLGVVLVGLCEIYKGGSGSQVAYTGLIIGCSGEFVRAAHFVSAELIIKGKYTLHPIFVGGAKGIWGLSLMVLVLAAVTFVFKNSSGEPVEDTVSTFYMISHSKGVAILLSILFVLFFVADVGCMFITKYLSAVHNSLSSVMRGLFIWAVELAVYKCGFHINGEEWNSYSLLKLVGFLVVGVATFIFNGSLRLPFFYYPPAEKTVDCAKKPLKTDK